MFSKTKNKRARIFVCSGIFPTVFHVVAVVNNLAVVMVTGCYVYLVSYFYWMQLFVYFWCI